jgi:hypothetical protein
MREIQRLGPVLVNLPTVRDAKDPLALDVAHALGIPLEEFRPWSGPTAVSKQIRQLWSGIEGKATLEEFRAIMEIPETFGYLEFAEQGNQIVHVDYIPNPTTTRVLEMVKGRSIIIPPWNYPKLHGDLRAWGHPQVLDVVKGVQGQFVLWNGVAGNLLATGNLPYDGGPLTSSLTIGSIPMYIARPNTQPRDLKWFVIPASDLATVMPSEILDPLNVPGLISPFSQTDDPNRTLGLAPIMKSKEKPDARPARDYLGGAPYPPPIKDGEW